MRSEGSPARSLTARTAGNGPENMHSSTSSSVISTEPRNETPGWGEVARASQTRWPSAYATETVRPGSRHSATAIGVPAVCRPAPVTARARAGQAGGRRLN